MKVTNPLILWGLLAILVPIIIHLFGRKARKTALIPSLMWVKELKTSQRRKQWVKDWLVLLLRILTIIFVVISLLDWRSQGEFREVVVDHHPAGWETGWYRSAVNQLAPGTYRTYLKDGSYLGDWDKSALQDVLNAVHPQITDWQPFPEATLLSFGFDSIQTKYKQVILPQRNPLENQRLEEYTDDQRFEWRSSTAVSLPWEIRKNGALYATTTGTSAGLNWSNVLPNDTFEITSLADSLRADNTTVLYQRPPLQVLAITSEPATPWSTNYVDLDSAVTRDAVSAALVASYDICILEGFDYIPQAFEGYQGVLLHFLPMTSSKSNRSIPVLDHPFFSRYFFGPSMQNAWPKATNTGYLSDTLTSLLQDAQQQNIAGIAERGSFRYYQQSFFPLEQDHPYYHALFQWAGALRSVQVETPQFLGNDHYPSNTALPQAVRYDELVNSTTLPDEFWTREKIALALALLSALLALIFAKI